MKKLAVLLLFLLFISAQAQNKDQLLARITNEVCSCIENVGTEKLTENSIQVLTNCVQVSFSKNIDDIMGVYGDEAIQSAKVGEEIGIEVGSRLINDCPFYSDYLGGMAGDIEIEDGNYTPGQTAMIDQLSIWACDCSKNEVENNPNVDLQKTLETCLQQSVIQNMDKLTAEFGDELLTNQNMSYNIGVDVGNTLIQTCDLFLANNAEVAASAKGDFEIGKVRDYESNGDFIVVTLLSEDGLQSEFVVNYGFDRASEFVGSLKDLKQTETTITIYFYEDELFFKNEDVKKRVNVIEDVKF